MNNSDAERLLLECLEELNKIEAIQAANLKKYIDVVEYINKYSLVRACGTVEFVFKKLILDVLGGRSTQIDAWLEATFQKQGIGPTLSNIQKWLRKFDAQWQHSYCKLIKHTPGRDRIKNSLISLVNNRNSFAHGGAVTITISDVQNYYADACVALKQLDAVLPHP